MPKKSSLLSPPTAEAQAEVLVLIRQQREPIASKAIAKLLPIALRMTEADLTATLQKFVSTAQIWEYPSKTARGPVRYWDRDTRQLAQEAVLNFMPTWPEPLSAKELSSRLGLPFPLAENDLAAILADYVTRGDLHEIPGATAKGKVRFWNHDRVEFYRRAAIQVLESKGPLPEAKLQSALKGVHAHEWQQVLAVLIAARTIFFHPPVGKKGKAAVGLRPPAADAYLKEIAGPLATIVATLTEAGVSPDDLRRAIIEMVEAAGITFGVSRTSTTKAHEPDSSSTAMTSEQLIALMLKMEPGAARGTLIGVRDLRRLSHMDKAAFDTAILQLSRQGKIALHWHDFPASLPPEERDQLVSDGTGNYYIGVALRTVEGGDRS